MPTFALSDLDATERLASALAPQLREGDVVELHGEMGAGKTTFAGAVASALGSIEPARSPTYTIAHAYELADGRTLAHLDCYRQLGRELDDAAWGDLEPYSERSIALVEWPDPIRARLTAHPTWIVQLQLVGLDARTARIVPPAGRDAAAVAIELVLAFS